jgi:rhamnulokinase
MTRDRFTVAAVDLGASSGRVITVHGGPDGVTLREVHRFANEPVRIGGVLRWDVLSLFGGIVAGLRKAEAAYGRLDSVGVDGWGVDYGLLDADGQLIGNPAHYRDPRTTPTMARVLETVGATGLYSATGTQLQAFNTLFQLLTDRDTAMWAAARTALLVPDLMAYWLCGVPGTELTNASTTGLLDPRTMAWSADLAQRLGLPVDLFPRLRRPGQVLGPLCTDVVRDAGLHSTPVVTAVGSHDTASAVAGVPTDTTHYAYVCTGTWALVGVDLPAPVITEEARQANFTNEVGVDATVRFLRNVTGFWLLQECLREWPGTDAAALTREAATVPRLRAVIDVQQPGFASPGDMVARVVEAAARTSGVQLTTPAEITRCILDSMALAIRHAVHDAVRLSGHRVDTVHVVGGGAVNDAFCQAVADACRLPVVAGPTEAAAWGNARCQLRALGVPLPPGSVPTTAYAVNSDEEPWSRAGELVRG